MKKKTVENNLHKEIYCDGCNKEIRGRRYKCVICKDFDLCSTYEQTNEHFGHAMLRLVKPDTLVPEWLKMKVENFTNIESTSKQNIPSQKRTKKTTLNISQKSKSSISK